MKPKAMKLLAFRNTFTTVLSRFSLNPKSPFFIPATFILSPRQNPNQTLSFINPSTTTPFCTVSMASLEPCSPHLEKQFDEFRVQLEESGKLRESIRAVTSEIESTARIMHASLLLVHQSRPIPEVLEKAKDQIGKVKELYSQLAEILRGCPGQYYRYHGDWRSETQTVVSVLAFMHWLETGDLLLHTEAEEKLGLNSSDFSLDVEDYLVGICFMSNEMPRYVVNQVTAGEYDCPRRVMKFLTDLHASFRKLNLRNDFLRKKFDGMKYDLRRVEEVYYDVKIRGLAANGDSKDEGGS